MINNPKENRPQSSDPSDATGNSNVPRTGEREEPSEGEFRNVQTSVNNPENFDDSYESEAEDELTMEEPKTEKDSSTGKS